MENEQQGAAVASDSAGSAPESSGPSIREALDQAVANSNVAEGDKVRAATSPAPSRETGAGREVPAPEQGGKDARSLRRALENTTHSKMIENQAQAAGHATPLHHLSATVGSYVESTGLGVGAEQFIGEVLHSEYLLRHGTPQEKMATLQRICEHYNIPLPQGGQAPRAPSPAPSKPKAQAKGNKPDTALRDTLRAAYSSRSNGRA
jgi:hypothetical protein